MFQNSFARIVVFRFRWTIVCMKSDFLQKIATAHQKPKALPGASEIDVFLVRLLEFLFPELNNVRLDSESALSAEFSSIKLAFERLLEKTSACESDEVISICEYFFKNLETVYDRCLEDAEAILNGDPAAFDRKEVIRTYPGFLAIAIYRIANIMAQIEVPYLPRIFTEYAHSKTGIDIHPKAQIGRYFCIDHGTGVVIGETTNIGDHVKLYQGVTLGALSVSKEMAKVKRHPTIGDHVVIYAGATILGGETNIGSHSIIGGNAWITESIQPNSRVYYQSEDNQSIKVVI